MAVGRKSNQIFASDHTYTHRSSRHSWDINVKNLKIKLSRENIENYLCDLEKLSWLVHRKQKQIFIIKIQNLLVLRNIYRQSIAK